MKIWTRYTFIPFGNFCITEGTEWIMTFGGILSDITVSYIVTDALPCILSFYFCSLTKCGDGRILFIPLLPDIFASPFPAFMSPSVYNSDSRIFFHTIKNIPYDVTHRIYRISQHHRVHKKFLVCLTRSKGILHIRLLLRCCIQGLQCPTVLEF